MQGTRNDESKGGEGDVGHRITSCFGKRRLGRAITKGLSSYRSQSLSALCAMAFLSASAVAQDLDDIAGMDLAELGMVEIATGWPQTLDEAPAVASVITAEDIAAMGATNLSEILETVPGLHISPSSSRRLDPIYSLRGIHSQNASQVLMLVNGMPITQSFASGHLFHLRIPASLIERIEIIRGPGSALYGADAFAGVINIITHTPGTDTEPSDTADTRNSETEVGLLAGSFDSRGAWLRHQGTVGGWDLSFVLDGYTTDGDSDRLINIDGQSALDALFGTDASFAPSPLSTRGEYWNAYLALEREKFTFRTWAFEARDVGIGPGFGNQVLDPEAREDNTQWLFDLEYHEDERWERWEFDLRASYLYIDQQVANRLAPPGAILPIDADGNVSFSNFIAFVLFPEGAISRPGNTERVATLEGFTAFRGGENYRLRFGGGVRRHDVDTRSQQNFGAGVIDGSQPVVGNTLTDVTDTPFIFLEDQERTQWYTLAQGEWTLGKGWQLTAGIRYDEYSDVGGTTNPRIALVWQDDDRPVGAKFLYGSAFLAPSFAQTASINNPVNQGNPDLDPETIDTWEFVFDYSPNRRFRTVLNLFAYRANDLITLVPDPGATTSTQQNANEQEGHGIEFEATWDPNPEFQLRASYAWQHSEDSLRDVRVPRAPGRQAFLSLRYRPHAAWTFYAEGIYIRDRYREVGDSRPQAPNNAWVNLHLSYRLGKSPLEMGLRVRNLFDSDLREPSPSLVPEDYPLPGRSLEAQLRYRF